ncbi:MAG: hypothetical protein Q8R53_01155 [Nanoarchaeota archaeon]|nr:hypothetical protein [Nanoarchaeota archaeon]
MKRFENEAPLENKLDVLEILLGKSQGNNTRFSTIYTSNSTRPYVKVTHAHNGDSGGYSEEHEYYLLTPQAVTQLKQDQYISGVPYWGYTSETELRITTIGEEFYYSEKSKQREEEKRQREEELKKLENE